MFYFQFLFYTLLGFTIFLLSLADQILYDGHKSQLLGTITAVWETPIQMHLRKRINRPNVKMNSDPIVDHCSVFGYPRGYCRFYGCVRGGEKKIDLVPHATCFLCNE